MSESDAHVSRLTFLGIQVSKFYYRSSYNLLLFIVIMSQLLKCFNIQSNSAFYLKTKCKSCGPNSIEFWISIFESWIWKIQIEVVSYFFYLKIIYYLFQIFSSSNKFPINICVNTLLGIIKLLERWKNKLSRWWGKYASFTWYKRYCDLFFFREIFYFVFIL